MRMPPGPDLRRRSLIVVAVAALALLGFAPATFANDEQVDAHQGGGRGAHWVATWSASAQRPATPVTFSGQTLRQIVHTSIGGAEVRVLLSNVFGTTALVIGAAHIAIRSAGAEIVP